MAQLQDLFPAGGTAGATAGAMAGDCLLRSQTRCRGADPTAPL